MEGGRKRDVGKMVKKEILGETRGECGRGRRVRREKMVRGKIAELSSMESITNPWFVNSLLYGGRLDNCFQTFVAL